MSAPHVHAPRRKHARKPAKAKGGPQTPAAPNGAATSPESPATHGAAFIDSDQREEMIRKAAYYRAVSRCFDPGREVDDWLAAEAEVDRALATGDAPTPCGG